MADRSLRGMRLGSQSLQSEEGVEFAPIVKATYRVPDGNEFTVTFSADAEIPDVWESPKSRELGILLAPDGELVELPEEEDKTVRTHWDMLQERRSIEELDEMLETRLAQLLKKRGLDLTQSQK